jgi:hypothetical protein
MLEARCSSGGWYPVAEEGIIDHSDRKHAQTVSSVLIVVRRAVVIGQRPYHALFRFWFPKFARTFFSGMIQHAIEDRADVRFRSGATKELVHSIMWDRGRIAIHQCEIAPRIACGVYFPGVRPRCVPGCWARSVSTVSIISGRSLGKSIAR